MKKMIKYPSIGQFRNVVKTVRDRAKYKGKDEDGNAVYFLDHEVEYPVIEFTGTVKLHGTHLDVVYNSEGELYCQSRGRIIDVESDNAGSAFFVMARKESWIKMINQLIERYNIDMSKNSIAIPAEVCGAGIQKGVAINEVDKFVAIFKYFKVKPNDENKSSYWLET